MRRAPLAPQALVALVAGLAPACVGVEELFVALGETEAAQWIIVEGEGSGARLTLFDPGRDVFRAPEGTRVRALIYREPALPEPLPEVSTEGVLLPLPSSFLELVPSDQGYDWRESAFSSFELRVAEPSPCGRIESESLVSLPLLDVEENHRSSIVLSDGRLLVGGVEHLFIIDDGQVVRSPWSATATGAKDGPRTLSESAEGVWFEAAGDLYFAPLAPGVEIEPVRQTLLPPGQTDFVYAVPADDRLLLVDKGGAIFERRGTSSLRLLFSWELNGQVRFIGEERLVLLLEGDEETLSLARYARYEGTSLVEDRPFGDEPTRRVSGFVRGRDYFIGGDGGRLALDRGDGWQRLDVESGSLGRVRGVAETPRGFLVASTSGELVEYVHGHGFCPPSSFQGVPLDALHALGDQRYVALSQELSDGVRFFRLRPP